MDDNEIIGVVRNNTEQNIMKVKEADKRKIILMQNKAQLLIFVVN